MHDGAHRIGELLSGEPAAMHTPESVVRGNCIVLALDPHGRKLVGSRCRDRKDEVFQIVQSRRDDLMVEKTIGNEIQVPSGRPYMSRATLNYLHAFCLRDNLCNAPCGLWFIMLESTRASSEDLPPTFIRPSLRDLDATTTRSFYHKVVPMGLGVAKPELPRPDKS